MEKQYECICPICDSTYFVEALFLSVRSSKIDKDGITKPVLPCKEHSAFERRDWFRNQAKDKEILSQGGIAK